MAVVRAYGMLHPGAHTSATVRATFVIDPEGVIRAIIWYPMNVGRSVDELLRLLTALQSDKSGVFTPEGGVRAIRCWSRRRWWRRTSKARPQSPCRRTGISGWSPLMTEHGRKKRAAGLHGRAEEVSDILKLLGNPQRLLIACLLCEGEYAVSEIEENLGIRQPKLSQQTGALREAGVIEGRRRAKEGRDLQSGRCADASSPRRAASQLLSRGTLGTCVTDTRAAAGVSAAGAASFARVVSSGAR